MGKALPLSAAVSLCLISLAGCVSRGEPGPAFPEQYSSEAMGSPTSAGAGVGQAPRQKGAWNSFVSTMTDNPVTRGFKSAGQKTAETLTPKPREYPAYDPVSLNSNAPKPDAGMFVSLAKVQESGGNLQVAEEMYQKALQLDKSHVPALLGLAQMRFRQQRQEEAYSLFTQALKADPNNLEAILGQAHYHDTRENMAEATRLYTEATQRHPQSGQAWNDLGLCLARQRRLPESQQTLQKAVQLEPENILYRNNLATVLVELHRPDEALAHLQQAHGPAAGHYNLGYLLHRRGENQAAMEQFTMALRVDPGFEPAQQWLDKLNAESASQRAARPPFGRSAALLRGPDGRGLNLYTQRQRASGPPTPPEIEHLAQSAFDSTVVETTAESSEAGLPVPMPNLEHASRAASTGKQAATRARSTKSREIATDVEVHEEQIPAFVEISDREPTAVKTASHFDSAGSEQVQTAFDAQEPAIKQTIDSDSLESHETEFAELEPGITEPESVATGLAVPTLAQPGLVTGDTAEDPDFRADPIVPAPQYPRLQRADTSQMRLERPPLPVDILREEEADGANTETAEEQDGLSRK